MNQSNLQGSTQIFVGPQNYYSGMGGGWLRIPMIIRLSQPSLAGVGAGAELGDVVLVK